MNEPVPLSEVLDEVFPWEVVTEESRRIARQRRRRERWAQAGIILSGILAGATIVLACVGLGMI